MPERFNGLNMGSIPGSNKTGRMVNSLVSVIHSNSNPNPSKSMTQGSIYLRENNSISIYPKTLRGAFHDRYDKGVDCE